MNQIAVKQGTIYGGSIFAYSMVTFFWAGDFKNIDLERLAWLEWLGFARYLLMFIGIMIVIKQSLDQEARAGFLQLLKPAALSGLVIALFVGVMESLYILIHPAFLKNYSEVMIKKMQEEGKTVEQIAQFSQEMEAYVWMQTPLPMGLFYFVETFVVCLVLALVLIPILKWWYTKNNGQLAR